MVRLIPREEQMKIFNTDVCEACDDCIEAFKQKKDADDRLESCRKFLAGLLKEKGLGDKESIKHDGKIITLKHGVVTDDSVGIKDAKD